MKIEMGLPVVIGVAFSSTILASAGLLISLALRRRAPLLPVLALRATLVAVGLSTLLCVAGSGRVRPLWSWPVAPIAGQSAEAAPPRVENIKPSTPMKSTRADEEPPIAAMPAATSEAAPNHFSWAPILAMIWLAGVLLLLAWTVACHFFLWNLRRVATNIESTPAGTQMRDLAASSKIRAPRLLSSERVRGPLLCGLWRPAIMLPAAYAAAFDEAALRAVLLHELTHLRRLDLWWNALARTLCALLWPQVLLWIVARRLEATSEEVCDAAVLEGGCAPRDYARCLLDLAERFSSQRAERVAGAGVLPLRSALGRRVQRILDEARPVSSRLSWRARLLAAVFLLVGAASSLMLGAANPKIAPPDLSSPQATVRSFVAAINAKDVENAAACVQGALPKNELPSEWLARGSFEISIEDLKVQKDQAAASAKLQVLVRGKALTGKEFETREKMELKLERQSDEWKILARQDAKRPLSSLPLFAATLAPSGLDKLRPWIARNSPAAVTGRVLHEDGKPAANVKIGIQMPQEQFLKLPGAPQPDSAAGMWLGTLPPSLMQSLSRSVTTNESGVYTVAGLAAAPYIVAPPPYQRIYQFGDPQELPAEVATSPQRVQLRRGETVRAPDITLTRGALVNVRIVDQAADRPLPNITVIGTPGQNPNAGSSVQTDSRGSSRFRFPAGKVKIAVGGQSVPGTHTFAVQVNGDYYNLERGIETFVDGQKMTGFAAIDIEVQAGQTRAVTFRLKKYVVPQPTPTASPMAMPRGAGVLRGRVIYADNRPAAGVRVNAIIQRKARWALFRGLGLDNKTFDTEPAASTYEKLSGVLQAGAMTDKNGDYRLSGLTTAPYNLIVGHATVNGGFYQPPKGWVAVAHEGVWAKDGQTLRRARDLVLTRGSLIEGRLRDAASGEPLGGAFIAYYSPAFPTSAEGVMAERSDAQGRFGLRVPAGTTSLSLTGMSTHNLADNAVYVDTGTGVKGYIIDTSRGPHDSMKRVEYSLDGGARRPAFTSSWHIDLDMKSGQTRRLDFWLHKVKPKN